MNSSNNNLKKSGDEIRVHRKFVHDISNYLTVIDGSLRKCQKELDTKLSSDKTIELISDKFDLSLTYIKKSITELKEYRSFIHNLTTDLSKEMEEVAVVEQI